MVGAAAAAPHLGCIPRPLHSPLEIIKGVAERGLLHSTLVSKVEEEGEGTVSVPHFHAVLTSPLRKPRHKKTGPLRAARVGGPSLVSMPPLRNLKCA